MFTLLLLWSASIVVTTAHEVWWDITYVHNVNPDGIYPRQVIGVNGTWPPPPLSVNSSDTLTVHVTNSLDVPTSLHHHGMFFNSTGWNDGAAGITQCGIPPGQTLSYYVPVNSSGQRGTYWFHSHINGQYVDGLRGPLVIHPAQEVFAAKYDEEFIVVLGDWYHLEHKILIQQYINVGNPNGVEPIPDSPLIYFAQGSSYLGPKTSAAPTVYPTTAHVGFNQNSTLPFQPGKTYRLRIINMSAFASFFFWIDGHDMRIIEVDGTDVQESKIDVVNLAVGQRHSVLVTARSDIIPSNWAIHANMDPNMFAVIPPSLNPNATSSITYSPLAAMINNSPVPKDFYHSNNDTALVPYFVKKQLPPATRTIDLEVSFAAMSDGTNRGMFNNVTYNIPKVPSLFTEVEYASQNINQSAYGLQTFVLDHLDIVNIKVKNSDTGSHPFHIHGHVFQIVNRASNYSSDDPAVNPPLLEGQPNPIRRDTAVVPSLGSATIRFVADNPGSWIFHCHIDWHLSVGLAVVFIEAPPRFANSIIPQVMKDQCRMQGLLSQGNAAGHLNPNDLDGLPAGPFLQNKSLEAKRHWGNV